VRAFAEHLPIFNAFSSRYLFTVMSWRKEG